VGDEELYLEERAAQWERGLTRGQLLKLAATLPLLAGAARVAPARAAAPAGPIVKPLPPEWFVSYGSNAELRWDSVSPEDYTTPNERFFVRDHTSTPTIDADTWRLRVFGSGLSGDEASFGYDELRALPAKTVTAFIECAGNGRSFFASQQGTPAAGTQWGLGAIGVAKWRGVPLSEVLERAGIAKSAVDVLPQGLDPNVVSGGVDLGRVRRPLPVSKALDDVLLAYEMNGEPLPPDHGFPVRLVVPGWVGIASIKWLGQIEVADTPLFSPWNTTLYKLTQDSPPLTTQAVKSAWELARGATLAANRSQVLTGRSWSGTSPIERVDVSIDHGASWRPAELHGRNAAGTWVQWDYRFPAEPAGSYELWARATDGGGRVQPTTVPFNANGYLYWGIVRHPVTLQ
jgi:DMSO/TMAO reductase YedYZ molybdopterin-dependent catalytic subunit